MAHNNRLFAITVTGERTASTIPEARPAGPMLKGSAPFSLVPVGLCVVLSDMAVKLLLDSAIALLIQNSGLSFSVSFMGGEEILGSVTNRLGFQSD